MVTCDFVTCRSVDRTGIGGVMTHLADAINRCKVSLDQLEVICC